MIPNTCIGFNDGSLGNGEQLLRADVLPDHHGQHGQQLFLDTQQAQTRYRALLKWTVYRWMLRLDPFLKWYM